MSQVSILVPAFNEAAVIGSTLAPITGKGFEIIVIANGCSDQTAEVARSAAPDAAVLETTIGDKTNALNLGLAAAKHDIIVVLDADTLTTAAAVRELAGALEASKCCLAYGMIDFNLDASSWAVRAFYKAWQKNTYFDKGKVGAFFALKKSALENKGGFADVTNDDEWVRRTFANTSTLVAAAHYSVRAPRDLANLIQVRRRVRRGNRDLKSGGVSPIRSHTCGQLFLMIRLILRPWLWLGAGVYAYTYFITEYTKPARQARWERDLSNRTSEALGDL